MHLKRRCRRTNPDAVSFSLVTTLEVMSREGEGQQLTGRSSLDIFSPLREGQSSTPI